jgi:DNA-binding MarR family transcriptional regulator
MEKPPFLDNQYRLWMLLAQTRGAISKAREKRVKQYMPPNQAAALVVIWAYKGRATPTLLSRYLFQEHHSISGLIARMGKNGLVTKNKDDRLKRVVRIAITAKGQEIISNSVDAGFIHSVISCLTEKEQKQLESSLQVLLKRACAEIGMKSLAPLPDD